MSAPRRMVVPAIIVALITVSTVGPSLAAGGVRPLIDPTVASKVTAGSTRVIVELRLLGGFRPEGALSDAAVLRQRQEIVDTRQAVLARLRGTRSTVLHAYSSVPMLALEIGPDALTALQQPGILVQPAHHRG